MATSPLLKTLTLESEELIDTRRTVEKIRDTHSKELIIGLCGPIGAPLRAVADALNEVLEKDYAYKPSIIKLSQFIERYTATATASDALSRYIHLIKNGNEMRKKFGNSILAELAVREIAERRADEASSDLDPEPKPIRFCHIVNSVKNTEEIELLRTVYGELFVLLGIHSSPEDRSRCLKAYGVPDLGVSQLMDRDSGEDITHGQDVRNAYPMADFFIHAKDSNTTQLSDKLRRLLALVTRTKIITPTADENAMYSAQAAALNSGCLSRQVGAAITDSANTIIGLGWNDVPRFGGGLYSDSKDDHRCMHLDGGKCFNDFEKDILADQIADRVVDSLRDVIQGISSQRAVVKVAIKKSRIRDLIEFSRAVHAEMMAIINAGVAGNGPRLFGARIFVTTYPCHSCARHIIASGIAEVVYIEPYRKSLATKLHSDALSEESDLPGKVIIRPFEGVGPSRYSSFFCIDPLHARKNSAGQMTVQRGQTALFSASASLKSIPALEGFIVEQLARGELANSPGGDKFAS